MSVRVTKRFGHSKLRASVGEAISVLLFVAITCPAVLGECKCRPPENGETTHWGGNQSIVLMEKRSYRELEGIVQSYDGKPIEHALVEVFDNPEYLLEHGPIASRPTQKRVRVCRTAADGKFCFTELPSGEYELRSSLDIGWNVTHVYVVIDKNTGGRGQIKVRMAVGT